VSIEAWWVVFALIKVKSCLNQKVIVPLSQQLQYCQDVNKMELLLKVTEKILPNELFD
jgi:hypothetical protein